MYTSLQGYEDILCGSCAPGYGKVRSLECVKCQGKSSSLLGLVLVSIWLWLLAVMLIRKSLTWANEISTRGGRETMSGDRRDYEISKNRASEVAKVQRIRFYLRIACEALLTAIV